MSRKGQWKNETQMGIIKFRQEIEITIAAGSASNTGALTQTVDPTRTELNWLGMRPLTTTAALNPNTDLPDATLTNGNTITVTTRAANATDPRTVLLEVIEYWPWACQSVQYGKVSAAAAVTGTTGGGITAVDTTRSYINFLGCNRDQAVYNMIRDAAAVTFTASQVTLTRGNFTAADNISANFCVVQMQKGILKSVQQVTPSTVTLTSTGTQAISAVVAANTRLTYGGYRQATLGTNNSTLLGRLTLTSGTLITIDMGAANTGTVLIPTCAVEYNARYVKSRQHINNAIAAGAGSHDQAITAVRSLNKTIGAFLGEINDVDAVGNRMHCTAKLTTTTNSQAAGPGTPVGTIRTVGHQIMEMA